MENGNILEYTRKHPEVNRMTLASLKLLLKKIDHSSCIQLVDVAKGLQYLHGVGQVHGNIRGVSFPHITHTKVMPNILQANVLMSNDSPPRARLSDFGLNAIMFDVFSMSKASVNWTAPEIFAPGERDFRPTFASDIYALGMLIYEVTCPT